MASSVPSSVPAAVPQVRPGVAPLRAGQGISFVLRRLHSLSGIVPVGAFLVEHFISNAFATNGVAAYTAQVKFLTGLPFAELLEVFGIYIPIAYHALYGIYIWWRGESNATDYPYVNNWMYVAQRWTGIVAFAYILYHTYTMRFTGVHLFGNPGAAFGKVQLELSQGWPVALYIVGIVTASWHFAYGLFLFCAKWGIVVGDKARKRFGVLCLAIGLLFAAVGLYTLRAFVVTPTQPIPEPGAQHEVSQVYR